MLCNDDDLFLATASRTVALHREWVVGWGGVGEEMEAGGGQRSTEWEAKQCTERAPQLHTQVSPLELLTDGHCIESCSPEVVRILWG